jgi:hypothetical protein
MDYEPVYDTIIDGQEEEEYDYTDDETKDRRR